MVAGRSSNSRANCALGTGFHAGAQRSAPYVNLLIAIDMKLSDAPQPHAAAQTSPDTAGLSTEMISGAEILCRALKAEGVEYVFGYPGGAVLVIYDEIYKQKAFSHILVRHEQAAVHAADAYSRSTGKVGVALVTSGPGVTNAVTGIATAYMDSIPIVVITGQVPTHAIGLCVSGVRHGRHYAAMREAQFPRKRCRRSGRDIEESFLHCRNRAAWPGGGRYSKRRVDGQGALRLSGKHRNALV